MMLFIREKAWSSIPTGITKVVHGINLGIRIDHILLSPNACHMFKSMRTHTNMRGTAKPSDHVPVSAEFTLA